MNQDYIELDNWSIIEEFFDKNANQFVLVNNGGATVSFELIN